MNAVMRALLAENLKSLRLSSMMKNLESELRQAQENSISYEEFLLNLSETEVQHRGENGRKRPIKEAGFPLFKPLETFDFDASPELDRRLIRELATGEYLEEKRNIIFMGKRKIGDRQDMLILIQRSLSPISS